MCTLNKEPEMHHPYDSAIKVAEKKRKKEILIQNGSVRTFEQEKRLTKMTVSLLQRNGIFCSKRTHKHCVQGDREKKSVDWLLLALFSSFVMWFAVAFLTLANASFVRRNRFSVKWVLRMCISLPGMVQLQSFFM